MIALRAAADASRSIARASDPESAPSRTKAGLTAGLYSAASLGKRSWRMRVRVRVRRGVGFVFPERLSDRVQKRSDSHGARRRATVEPAVSLVFGVEDSPRRNPSEPARTGSAQDAMENRLGLVVAGVPDRDGAGLALAGDAASANRNGRGGRRIRSGRCEPGCQWPR